jgi:hypothetical protein
MVPTPPIVALLDASGNKLNTPLNNELSAGVSTVVADGSGKFIATNERLIECSPDIATLGSKKCSSLHVNIYNSLGLVDSQDVGGQWGNSLNHRAIPSVVDGGIAFPLHHTKCLDCVDTQTTEVVQISAPVKRLVWDDIVIDPMVDSDHDALPDNWEINGINGIDLKKMGADPNRADIFVHLDWMKGMKLSSDQIRKVVTAFDKSPYVNPDKSLGINLHVDQGPDSIMNFKEDKTWDKLSRAKEIPLVPMLGTTDAKGEYVWKDFDDIKNSSFVPTGRVPVFRYVLSSYKFSELQGRVGLARGLSTESFYGSSDIVLGLGSAYGGGSAYKEFVQGATLMHELGHNLSLRHGGNDDINNKPNYVSIMNYIFNEGLFKGDTKWLLDYSNRKMPTLNETALDETAGLGPSIYGSKRYCNWIGYVNCGWNQSGSHQAR